VREPFPTLPYHIGCPVWASAGWVGKLFAEDAPRQDWLGQYAACFNTVEGNSTFYALPAPSVVRRWASETPDHFRFCLKFPRAISHDRQLVACHRETADFVRILELIAEHGRLGPSFLQLPPKFAGKQFFDLERYLRALPRDYPYAVEVRHWNWFDEGRHENRLNALLLELEIDRVLFDSRPLFAAPPADDAEDEAQRKKPRPPARSIALGPRPMVRLIGRNDIAAVDRWLQEWAPIVAGWIREGRTPYFFTHTPDDWFAPDLARRFHTFLTSQLPDLPSLPLWPAEVAHRSPKQGLLF
jgi:uncharacterized protein YecE (DUF72 family)